MEKEKIENGIKTKTGSIKTKMIDLDIPRTIVFLPEHKDFETTILEHYNKHYAGDSPLDSGTQLYVEIIFYGTRTDHENITDMANAVLEVLEGIAFDDRKNITTLMVNKQETGLAEMKIRIRPEQEVKYKVVAI